MIHDKIKVEAPQNNCFQAQHIVSLDCTGEMLRDLLRINVVLADLQASGGGYCCNAVTCIERVLALSYVARPAKQASQQPQAHVGRGRGDSRRSLPEILQC